MGVQSVMHRLCQRTDNRFEFAWGGVFRTWNCCLESSFPTGWPEFVLGESTGSVFFYSMGGLCGGAVCVAGRFVWRACFAKLIPHGAA
jgi:hypothetical protein